MPLKIKDEYKNHFVAFGGRGENSRKKLGERTDLHRLARLGLTRNPRLLDYFDGEVTMEEVEELEQQAFEKQRQRQGGPSAEASRQSRQSAQNIRTAETDNVRENKSADTEVKEGKKA